MRAPRRPRSASRRALRWAPRAVVALFACAALALGGACGPLPRSETKPTPTSRPVKTSPIAGLNLTAARELDQQGARAYAEGRFREASRYFEEAFLRGGPAHELWNMARCQQKLDDLEGAAALIERYLEQERLSPGDRDEARRELAELLRKPSRVTVITTPPGASVFVDDRRNGAQGRTPLTLELAPGDHVLTLELAGRETETERVTARYGRSVIVETRLSK